MMLLSITTFKCESDIVIIGASHPEVKGEMAVKRKKACHRIGGFGQRDGKNGEPLVGIQKKGRANGPAKQDP